ncbi:hypothetical protein HY061_01980 [Candidatus Azambacteria bacterium]|nr:hypothetical protein [Candidatus Azambacteria bacterium]
MKILFILFILIVFFNILTLNYQFFSYWWFDFNLLFLLIFAFLKPDYRKSIPLALILGIFSGLNSIFPISIFVIAYMIITFLTVLIIRNFITINLLSIIPFSFSMIILYQLLIVFLVKIYFLLGFLSLNIIFNNLYFKNLLNLGFWQTILLVLIYGLYKFNVKYVK